jgi:hypothetical protein
VRLARVWWWAVTMYLAWGWFSTGPAPEAPIDGSEWGAGTPYWGESPTAFFSGHSIFTLTGMVRVRMMPMWAEKAPSPAVPGTSEMESAE